MYFPCSQYPHEQRQCLTWLADSRLHASELITHRANPREAVDIYRMLDREPASCLGVIFMWRQP
jgi:threonine dehydrogenase-like Zn-dependent dehydrogenase